MTEPGTENHHDDEEDTAVIGVAQVPEHREPASPPPIDPAELVGLQSLEDQPTRATRISPLQDEASSLVARYLFPTERYRGEWKRHPIHLASPVSVAVLATIGLGLLSGFLETNVGLNLSWVVPLSVVLWLGVMAWSGWQIADWHFDRFILTNKRVMVVSGIVTRNVAMMPLMRVTDMKYEQTPMGRILNYGTFVIESAGQDQALREIPHLPNPNELYLRVVEEMYEPQAVEARLGPTDEESEDRQADA